MCAGLTTQYDIYNINIKSVSNVLRPRSGFGEGQTKSVCDHLSLGSGKVR